MAELFVRHREDDGEIDKHTTKQRTHRERERENEREVDSEGAGRQLHTKQACTEMDRQMD